MLKKINVNQLVVGMHLKGFCGDWMDHPFWRTSFVLTNPADIDQILASVIQEVWIDCSKGLDVASGETTVAESTSETEVDAELNLSTKRIRETVPCSASEEYARAATICAKAKTAVVSMFQEARMGTAINADGAQQLVEEITDSISRNKNALISLARLKTADDYTYMHSVAVCALMVALAKQLGLTDSEIHSAGVAGLMHDLGKAMMPLDVLNKPGKLTDDEFSIIKTHPEEGYALLKASNCTNEIAYDVVLHHHEKMDGSGYPKGLKGDEISVYAKMGAVCDVYDAITSNRPYKAGWCPAESLRRMASWSNSHFDPVIFQAFVKSIGIYPTGSLVRLSSRRMGVVIEQSEKSLLTPRIKVFFSIPANARLRPEIIDLSRPECNDRIVAREDPSEWDFLNINELWLL